jgi:hypothetical protein
MAAVLELLLKYAAEIFYEILIRVPLQHFWGFWEQMEAHFETHLLIAFETIK